MADSENVATPSAAHKEQEPNWKLCDDVVQGTRHFRSVATQYVPRNEVESLDDYRARVGRTDLYNGLRRTVRGLTGLAFRQNPRLGNDVSPAFVEEWEDIDNAGTHGDLFARAVFSDGMLHGHSAILVDYPIIETGVVRTLADEQALKIRPYWVHFTAANILSWRYTYEYGRMILTQIVLRQRVLRDAGAYGSTYVYLYRVFRRIVLETGPVVQYECWAQALRETSTGANLPSRYEPTGAPELEKQGIVAKQTEIPVAVFYAGEQYAPFVSEPPLLDLAYQNIAHFNVLSDHRHALHVASVPLLCFKGRRGDGAEALISPKYGFDVDVNGDIWYAEHTGAAIGQTRQELQDIEMRMASLGLALLARETPPERETATAKLIDKTEQDSALAVAVRNLSDTLERAAQFHEVYRDGVSGSIELNADYTSLSLDATAVTTFSTLVTNGQLSLETLWAILMQGGVLPEEFDPEKERELLNAAAGSAFTPIVRDLETIQKAAQDEQAGATTDATEPEPSGDTDAD